MLALEFCKQRDLKVLCLGAHCDDIEIGCGGTILKIAEQCPDAEFHWVVFSSTPARELEARACAEKFLRQVNKKNIIIKNFRDGFLPYSGLEIKEHFEQIKKDFAPDLIFTHYRKDLHQDHRLVNELTWNTFRNHLILEYEIPKWDGDMGIPNFFSPLEKGLSENKIAFLSKAYASQREKHWFTDDVFWSLLRLRGLESNAQYAEAFHIRKAIF